MILSCSSCSAKYLVDSHQIKFGRHVKCIRCGHIWYFENINYNPNENLKKNKENISVNQSVNSDSSNLPVVYRNNNKKNNLFFILFLFLVAFYAVYAYSESNLSLPLEELSIIINNFIGYLVEKIIFIFSV
jgi:predicted Zn finger-like uncharacterized protein